MTTTFKTYATTLKDIAANHKALQHTEEKKHFATVCTAAFVNEFGSVNIDEVLNGVRSLLLSPCLVADLPVIKVMDGKGRNKQKEYTGGFLILKKSTGKTLFDQTDDISECAQIGEEVLGWLDEVYLRAEEDGIQAEKWAINFNDVEIIPIAKLKDNWIGVRVNMPFKHPNQVAFEYNEDAFTLPL